MPTDLTLQERMQTILQLAPEKVAIESENAQATWGEIAQGAAAINAALDAAGVAADAPVGWSARNRPAAVAAFVALVSSGRMVVPLRPNFALATFRDDITTQRLPAVIGDHDDWVGDGVKEAARSAGSAGLIVTGPPFSARAVDGLERVGAGPHRPVMAGHVLERLTSGTTGAPKRIPVPQEVLIPSLRSGEQRRSDALEILAVKSSPALLFKPFSHAGGLFGLMLALYQARPIVLFERFDVARWVAAVARWKPKSASLVPAMIRMLLDSDADPKDLSSLLAIRSGTAALEPKVQEAFETRFGVPILIDYGAAEFIGGLAGWTLDDHKSYGAAKRGSVGRARGDVAIRAVDAESASPISAGEIGIIEVRSARYGPDWIRTNDLAAIDEDGFIFLRGRADDAINRGGFKILPDDVAAVLRQHPGVADAAVVGRADERLGQVPVAAIELPESSLPPSKHDLDAFLRERLPAYMVPVEYRVLDALPRTVSMKVARPELKALLGIA